MRFSRERLLEESAATGFRPEVLEKVLLLLDLLEAINENLETTGKYALKGGTALNLFFFDLPRLSVDIDLNYIGAEDRDSAIRERPRLEETLAQLARRLGLILQTPRREHAGVSWTFRYSSALGPYDNIKVDLNYRYRVPLWYRPSENLYQVGAPVYDRAMGCFPGSARGSLRARDERRVLLGDSRLLRRARVDDQSVAPGRGRAR